MANRGREAAALGRLLLEDPAAFPGALLALLKRSLRTIWDARGGGFYACGFVVALVWFELETLMEEIASSSSLAAFFGEQLLEFLLRFTVESLRNTLLAFVWPVFVLERYGGAGFVLLGALYLLFAYRLKAPLERWLFEDGTSSPSPDGARDDRG